MLLSQVDGYCVVRADEWLPAETVLALAGRCDAVLGSHGHSPTTAYGHSTATARGLGTPPQHGHPPSVTLSSDELSSREHGWLERLLSADDSPMRAVVAKLSGVPIHDSSPMVLSAARFVRSLGGPGGGSVTDTGAEGRHADAPETDAESCQPAAESSQPGADVILGQPTGLSCDAQNLLSCTTVTCARTSISF